MVNPGARLPDIPDVTAWAEEWRSDERHYDRILLQFAELERLRALRPGDNRLTTYNQVNQALAVDERGGVKGRPYNNTDGFVRTRIAKKPVLMAAADDVSSTLLHHARLYTFLPYREGLVAMLELAPFTVEQATHAYLRIVLLWARMWLPLTVVNSHEQKILAAGLPRGQGSAGVAGVGLPSVVTGDLEALFEALRREPAQLVAEGLANQVRQGVLLLRVDPTLTPVAAYNRVRPYANEQLGGALSRLRPSTDADAHDARIISMLSSRRWQQHPDEVAALLSDAPSWRVVFELMGWPGR